MYILFVIMALLVAGCSHGLQEVSFAVPDREDGAHYIVQRDVVSSRLTANQAHATGQFHCEGKYTSEEMATLRAEYGDHTWYYGCTPTTDMDQHKYAMTGDQSLGSLLQGPLSAAILGGSLVGMAALWPGDTINNSNRNTTGVTSIAGASATARGGSVTNTIRGPFRHGYRW